MQFRKLNRVVRTLGLIFIFLPVFHLAKAQSSIDTTLTTIPIETIVVKASKIEKPWLKSAASNYNISTEAKDQLAQNSLQEFLLQSPSIFALNANNRAQDLRISIRGFGSRAAFGVRGVKVIVDGIPETTADGQGQLDNLNLGIIEKIEVLNNGSAALYGNASGGVINILTTDENAFAQKNQFAKIGLGLHSFGGQQYQLTFGKKINKTSLILHGNHHQGNGYREQSGFQSTNFNFRLVQEVAKSGKLEAILNYMNSPTGDDPGGVNFESYDTDPIAARDRNLQFKTGEAINQLKASLRYEGALNENLKLNTYAFYSNRNFFGLLPFGFGGIVDLKRDFFGHGSALSGKRDNNDLTWNWQLGYELSSQRDDRERFVNNDGAQGETTLHQDELFSNTGLYFVNDLSINNWILNLALRYDFNHIEAKDKFLGNGDDSGEINLNDFNYSLGVAYQLSESKSLFANYSTSFETPTLNELSNNPDGSGFNADLKAQFANHLELGVKGFIEQKGTFQVSAFYVDSKDELLPFELESNPGQTFFRNVGNTERLGLEMVLKYPFNSFFTGSTNWAIHRFTFSDYQLDGANLEGNVLPGLPNFQGNIQLDFKLLKNLQFVLQNQFLGKIFTNDSNDEFQDPKAITNVSVKYNLEKEKFAFYPYLGVNNIFQTKYADNIRINAFGRRYYEAAPDLFLYGGVRVHF